MVPVGPGSQEITGTPASEENKFQEHPFSLKEPGCEGEEEESGKERRQKA